jgi:hypothetical protein
MATFHKMNDEPGTEIVRCFGPGARRHVSTQGSRISARRVALALFAVVLLLVLIVETASVRTSAASALPAPAAGAAPLLAPYWGMPLPVVAGFGRMAQRRTTSCRNGTI